MSTGELGARERPRECSGMARLMRVNTETGSRESLQPRRWEKEEELVRKRVAERQGENLGNQRRRQRKKNK